MMNVGIISFSANLRSSHGIDLKRDFVILSFTQLHNRLKVFLSCDVPITSSPPTDSGCLAIDANSQRTVLVVERLHSFRNPIGWLQSKKEFQRDLKIVDENGISDVLE